MTTYHVTNRQNLPSILERGLDPALARMKRKSVWSVAKGLVPWAIIHVASKPWNRDARLSDLVVIEIREPRQTWRRYHDRVWYSVEGRGCIPVTMDQVHESSEYGKVR